jgi:hypothetical protein
MARTKPKSAAPKVIDLLGEAFGIIPVRKRAKSIAPAPEPLLIAGIPYVPGPPPPHSTPLLQQPSPQAPHMQAPFPQLFCPQGPPIVPHWQYQHPITYGAPPNAPPPTLQDFNYLQGIDAHFNQFVAPTFSKQVSNLSEESAKTDISSKTTITITKHICANCGRLRSRKYHKDHPICPGREPAPEFCGKCQKDVSCTDSSDTEAAELNKKKSGSKRKSKGKRKKKYKVKSVISQEL